MTALAQILHNTLSSALISCKRQKILRAKSLYTARWAWGTRLFPGLCSHELPSRSPTIVIIWLLNHCNMTLKQVFSTRVFSVFITPMFLSLIIYCCCRRCFDMAVAWRQPTFADDTAHTSIPTQASSNNSRAMRSGPLLNPNRSCLLGWSEQWTQISWTQNELLGRTTIRFPDDGKEITVRTQYEWLQDDGSWLPRTTVTSPEHWELVVSRIVRISTLSARASVCREPYRLHSAACIAHGIYWCWEIKTRYVVVIRNLALLPCRRKYT